MTPVPRRRTITEQRHGITEFRHAVTRLHALADRIFAGRHHVPDASALRGDANRFEEALRDRRQLLKRLAAIAPDDPVLAEILDRDREDPKPRS